MSANTTQVDLLEHSGNLRVQRMYAILCADAVSILIGDPHHPAHPRPGRISACPAAAVWIEASRWPVPGEHEAVQAAHAAGMAVRSTHPADVAREAADAVVLAARAATRAGLPFDREALARQAVAAF